MREFKKPKIIVSQCLEYGNYHHNSEKIEDEFVRKLAQYADIKRCTSELQESEVDEVDALILKEDSSLCESFDSKLYSQIFNNSTLEEKSMDYFIKKIKEVFPSLIIEDEYRLKNHKLREDFLIRIFMLADLRSVIKTDMIKELIDFHSNNKYLIMSYNQNGLNNLGRIVANHEKGKTKSTMLKYKKELIKTLSVLPDKGKRINMLQHIFGYVSSDISKGERDYFLSIIEDYRDDQVPFSLALALLRSWIIRFKVEYLLEQTIFNPYPGELVDLKDSKFFGLKA